MGSLLKSESFINGQWVSGSETYDVINPFDSSVVSTVPDLGKEETENAVTYAAKAYESWSTTTAEHRSDLLRRWYELMIEHKEELARILTLEQGKPLKEAVGEIVYGASFIKWFSEEARRTYGEVIPSHASDRRIITLRQPIGVVAVITPWNFPNAMITRKLGPALAAGCTAVVKPAGDTPLSALALAALSEEAGIPPGVLNIITTNRTAEVGDVLTQHPTIRKLSFTGSTKVGKMLMEKCAATVKRVSMELGGNAPFIVFEDADIDKAVEGAIQSKYRNAGQTCVCSNRIFVHDDIYDEFVSKLEQASRDLKAGNGLDEGVDIGPLINTKAVDFLNELLADAKSKGAEMEALKSSYENNVVPPILVKGANASMRIHNEEIFGPVSVIYRFSSEEEVIQMANDTNYGLASYFYGIDNARIWRVAEALEYGMVGINTGLISTTVAPFGGIKESGVGREGSRLGIDEYLDVKYLCFGID